jgi:hypothetical protein
VLPLTMFALIIIFVSVILSSQQLRLITTDTFFSCGECFGSFNEVQSDIYICCGSYYGNDPCCSCYSHKTAMEW